jgi:catechol 2,3-dioxygenase
MSITHVNYVALKVPVAQIEQAIQFYTAFGLHHKTQDDHITFHCQDDDRTVIKLIQGGDAKRLHYVSLGTTLSGMQLIKTRLQKQGHAFEESEKAKYEKGLFFSDSVGIQYHVCISSKPQDIAVSTRFEINSPGFISRKNCGALAPKSTIADVKPLKLGHVLLFSADVAASVAFVESILDMRLSDRSEDIVAFTHCKGGSEHHVLAFAKSSQSGFHHASFQVATPDEVGIGGTRMLEKGYDKGWGFGRHSIGSNFFYYVRDPWGSYVEYYCDMDYIDSSEKWQAKNWPLEDSLHSWGPNPPEDFVHNYEAE